MEIRPPGRRLNHIKVNGQWKGYYRAVDKQGETIDFLLTQTTNTML
ncbi:MAG: transposase-like protein [Granulosicoccus sp.]|jgi:transposase-like protein